MTDRGFAEFLSEVWERRDWNTAVTQEDPGQFMITGDRPSGERGLMLVLPGEDETVAGKPVQTLVGICDAKNVDLGVVATRGSVTDDARRIAEANDVHLLDTDALEATVASEGLQDLVEEFTEETATVLDRLPIPSGLPSLFRRPSPPTIPTRALTLLLIAVGVGAVAIVGAQSMGVGLGPLGSIGALPGDGLGLGGGSEDITVTAVSLTGSTDDAVEVAWNARTQSTLVTENDTRYEAPAGQTFVVVEMTVTNQRVATSTLDASMLAFAANDTVREPRQLNGTESPLPVQLAPEESETLWVVFTIPEGETSGTLVGLPAENAPPIRFEHDPSVETGLERE